MTDEQYRYVTAALTLQEFLIRQIWANMTARHSDKGLADMGRDLKRLLTTVHLPAGVAPDEEALAIQREVLRQLDVFWERLTAERPQGTPAG